MKTSLLFWPKNPIYWMLFISLSGLIFFKFSENLNTPLKLILLASIATALMWVWLVMKDEIQKKIDPKKSFIIDMQNIILTGIIGISFAQISASILANNGTKLHIGTAVIAILGAQIISFVLTVQVLTMSHRRYQITVITALVFSAIAWYAPDFL